MSQNALDLFSARFGSAVLATGCSHGDEWARVDGSHIAEMARFLKEDAGLKMQLLVDLTCVDYAQFDPAAPLALDAADRFEVIYVFGSVTLHHRLRLKVRVGGGAPAVPSICASYRTANWWERLVWNFYGVRFEGHPDLRRILTYDSFEGHPLRKDYPIHKRQPLTSERGVQDLVRGPGPGPSNLHAPMSQRPGARPNTRSDAYD